MAAQLQNLIDEQTLVILAYADAGLGHLRVTNSLYEGLPKKVNPVLLRSRERTTGSLHQLTSTHPLFSKMLGWSQKGKQEEIITSVYHKLMIKNSKVVMKQVEEIVEQKMHMIHKVVVVCTHFGLAHQLADVKKSLEKKWKLQVFLVVCVTDDTAQKIWYVPEADIITVPSRSTKKALGNYDNIKVITYPVSPLLGKKFTQEEYEQKNKQLESGATDVINVSVPISGAAVGLEFAGKLIKTLHKINKRFVFNVVTHDNMFTKAFINLNQRRNFVSVLESSHPRRVVRLYDKMFLNSILSLEITKPSEQAFKALFSPKRRGGVILLFTKPVGRQEYDNLDYLRRNRLIPKQNEQDQLHAYALENIHFSDNTKIQLVQKAKQWRGMVLPLNPKDASIFINWCLSQGIFSGMGHSSVDKSQGVKKFWKTVDSLVAR